MTKKWLTNLYDPRKANARNYVTTLIEETEESTWQHQEEWLAGKIIGDPQNQVQKTALNSYLRWD